ncbi:3-deoxy-7-phosphoheptulonate synthase [Membranihabitans marinus]|uniref:3-deoxy-7-phosphoheptulonate synthase n=1 Tax=Membranihabitans marinus TaxID=1227546 RepID=UPI001F019605|nr:3-deoxy-7-phosphoheptulonate synthase [Membranihabitans marinus]
MIIRLASNYTLSEDSAIATLLNKNGIGFSEVVTQYGHYLVAPLKGDMDIRLIGHLTEVDDVYRVSDAYKLVSRKWKLKNTSIDLGDNIVIGDGSLSIMAGPCSIESEAQIESTVKHLLDRGISIMRGGVYKPRSSPYSFRGLGMEGLKLFYKHCQDNGIKVITEVMMVEQIEEMHDYVDIFQVGARNSQNFNLLDALGKIDKAVMIKRGISGTIEELLQSAEYVFSNGNEKILLCERGIRSYEKAYRNTMDVNAIAVLKDRSHLPVIADPSHGVGVRKYVDKIAMASVMAGADGVILEVHEVPQKAFSDGAQTLSYGQASVLYEKLRQLDQLKSQFATL